MTERERLIELLKVPIHPRIGADPAEVVADYLLDNGVIVPPCKVGDVIYFIHESGKAESFGERYIDWVIVGRISISNYQVAIYGSNAYSDRVFDVKGLGTVCFLSREEAEKALKEREKNA